MFSPNKTGRLKSRLRQVEANEAENRAAAGLLPELKAFLNGLPLKDRVRAAWRIVLGRF